MNDYQAKFQAIIADYVKRLPGKIVDIEKHGADLIKNFSHQKLIDYHREVHGLCGSSGTYGFPQLSVAARQFEVFLKKLTEINSELTEAHIFTMNQLIEQLKITFAQEAKLTRTENEIFPVSKKISENKLIYLLDQSNNYYIKINKELTELGYHLIFFNEPSELMKAINDKLPVVVISDINFVDDESFLAISKKNIPLFYLSDHDELPDRLKAIRHHGSFFFLKSHDINKLIYVITELTGSDLSEPYRVLIVDDSASLAEYYSLILSTAGMITEVLTKPLELIKRIEEFHPDLLLMDVYMPECTGIELAAVLRQQPLYMGLPIIFLSTEDDKFKQLSALSIGGDDFLTKPVLPQHLIATIQSRAKRAGILTSYMTRDSLTGILNHIRVMQQLNLELDAAKRKSLSLAFVMLDIDHFKRVNDTYGHPVGDQVLKRLSQLLVTQLRKTDIVGRYGGEEFAIILPGASLGTAIDICEDIRNKFAGLRFTEGLTQFSVTFSAGIATYPPYQEASELVAAADKALYHAKKSGRNQVQCDKDSAK